MSSDVITKLIAANDYKQGDAVVYQNEFLASSGDANLGRVQTYVTMSGLEDRLDDRFKNINFYAGSGV